MSKCSDTPTTDAREREAETPSDSPQLAALYVAIVRYGTVREQHPGDFHVRDEAAGVVGAAIEEWYTAVRATALAAVRAELTEVRLWLADANAQVTFHAKECATLRAALEYKGEALDAYRAAILATERARVRAVVENAPGYQRQGLFVSRADILQRLDAEPTP